MSPLTFTIHKKINGALGRRGTISTPHGQIETPAFAAVGTKATVKSLTPLMVKETETQVFLANTYHLYLEPGAELIEKAGGLHKFSNWQGPMITDSGGFQVFSLGAAYGKGISKLLNQKETLELPKAKEEIIASIASVDPNGVTFKSHIEGSVHYFTPEKSIDIQHKLGADIIFAFDECTSPLESLHYQKEALERTHRWAKSCLAYHKSKENSKRQALFGIVQGGRFEDLRVESAKVIADMQVEGVSFDGFGIGGSFESKDMGNVIRAVNEILPENKPRHMLGIGEPRDIFDGVENGCDMFDCVIPTRLGRNGTILTKDGKISIEASRFREDFTALDPGCECYTCKNFNKPYIAHLFRAKEMLAGTLASFHNLHFINKLFSDIRKSIESDTFFEFKKSFMERFERSNKEINNI